VGSRRSGGLSRGTRKATSRLSSGRLAAPDSDVDLRQHLARELHDRVAQTLSTMLIDLERFKSDQTGRAGVLSQVELLQLWTRDALANLRDIAYDLRGGEPVEAGDFPTALRTGLLEPFAKRTGIEVRMFVLDGWPEHLPAATALDLYRIVQEALQNANRHSRARTVEVSLGRSRIRGAIEISVTDDGIGLPVIGELRPGHGLIGMRERAAMLGGGLLTEPSASGGTAIRVAIPIA
jgi:two-component system sensor histidine kinase UhpB